MPLDTIAIVRRLLDNADTLIHKTTLSDTQRQFVVNIQDATEQLRDLILIIPNFPSERARQLLDYEGRSHLNNITGYSEMLLDEFDGTLDNFQRSLINIIYNSSQALLSHLNEMVG